MNDLQPPSAATGKRISRTSFILKWLFPVFWFGILGISAIGALLVEGASIAAVIMPVVMMVLGYFVMKLFIWDLADEVFDYGEYLVVRKGDLEQKIPLGDIVNVNYMSMSSPPRITILCRTLGPLGTEIAFMGPITFNPFKKPELVVDLIERVDRERRR